jgi:hypothetical protein
MAKDKRIFLELWVEAFMHPSVYPLSDAACVLWVRSIGWCADKSPTLWITKQNRLSINGSKGSADELVGAGLWLPDVVDGVKGHWLVRNELWRIRRRGYTRVRTPGWMRDAVLARDGGACLNCGSWDELQMDHIHPWSQGGRTTLDNLQTLCGPCNRTKGAQINWRGSK